MWHIIVYDRGYAYVNENQVSIHLIMTNVHTALA